MQRVSFFLCLFVALIAAGPAVRVKNQRLFYGDTEYYIKGVCYNPVPLGMQDMLTDNTGGTGLCSTKLTPYGEENSACFDSDFFDGNSGPIGRTPPSPGPWFQAVWERDFPEIVAAGFNTVRMYNWNPSTYLSVQAHPERYPLQNAQQLGVGKDHRLFMDTAETYGLKVVAPLFGDGTAISTLTIAEMEILIENVIDEVGNHSALLMWIYGNELGVMGRSLDFQQKYFHYVSYAKQYQMTKWNRPVPVTMAEVDLPASYNWLFANVDVDVFMTNAGYRGYDYSLLWSGDGGQHYGLQRLGCTYGRPIVIGEFGQHSTDGFVNINDWFPRLWQSTYEADGFGLIGGFFFEWNDEALKAENQRHMGIVKYSVNTYPDPSNPTVNITSRTANAWEPDTMTRKVAEPGYLAYDYNIVSGITRPNTAFCQQNPAQCNVNMNTDYFTFRGRAPYTYDNVPDICAGVTPVTTGTTTGTTGSPANLPVPWAHYSFEAINGGLVEDQSPNGRDATVGGAPTISTGYIGNAITFTRDIQAGGDQYLRIGIANLQTELSIAAWIRIPDSFANVYGKLVSSKVNWNDPAGFEVEYNPSLNQIVFLGSGDNLATAAIDLAGNTWHHITVINAGAVARIYLNGIDITTDETVTQVVPNNNRALLIGSSSETAGAGGAWLGDIDELYIFSEAISSTRINELMTGIFSTGTTATATTSSSTTGGVSTTGVASTSSTTGQVTTTGAADGSDGSDGSDGNDGSDGDGDGDGEEGNGVALQPIFTLVALYLLS